MTASAGRLLLAATPIGNALDASPRLADALREAAVVAAEDTRTLRRLLAVLEVTPRGRIVSYHDHNEAARAEQLLERLRAGDDVVLVSDAGMPSVSDPGYRLVAAAGAEGIAVSCVPGPSAVLAALAVSGLPVRRFCFEGFLPRRAGERARALAELSRERRTMVFFESPHRLAATLRAFVAAFEPDRPAVVCRELTKPWEEIRRGSLAQLAAWAADGIRGEVTLVVSGYPVAAAPASGDLDAAAAVVRERVAAGERLSSACREVAADLGLPRNALYRAAVAEPGAAGR